MNIRIVCLVYNFKLYDGCRLLLLTAWSIDNMSGRCLRSSNSSSNGEETTECMANLPVEHFKLGDIVWSRINGESWWPVQVADEKRVPCKQTKIKNDQILVRLYGTFEHLYVEPVNCVSKIEKIFDQENNSNRELFQKLMEEDITRMKSGGQSASPVFESQDIEEKGEAKDEAPGGKGQIKGKLKRTMIASNSHPAGSSDNPKAAKQGKLMMREGMDAVTASEVGITKRRTRSETLKARNEGTSGTEVSNETENASSGISIISSFDKIDLRSSRPKEKLNLNFVDKASESKCVKQYCGWNPDVNKNALIEFSDGKDIKKLVAKIVKEVAEKARNEALKSKWMERCPENTGYMESSRRKSSESKKRKRAIDDTPDRTAGPRDVEKLNGAGKRSNRNRLNKSKDFECERAKDNCNEMPNVAKQINNEIQGIQKGCLKEMKNGEEKSQSNFIQQHEAMMLSETKEALNGDQRSKVVKQDIPREKMISPGSTKCALSPRCTRVMQSLGLIAPLGSPFCRNRLIKSLLP